MADTQWNRVSFSASSPPHPPASGPSQSHSRYANRATSALARLTQPFFSGSRPPSPHNNGAAREDPTVSFRHARSHSLPGASQTLTHKTGLAIASLDISSQKTHAVIAGREVFKTIRVSPEASTEEFNLRNAILGYPNSQNVSGPVPAKFKDQLAIKDVKWSHGDFDMILATAAANGRIIIYHLQRPGLELSRFHGHNRQVHKLAINPHHPAWLLSGSQDGTIRMWDLRTAFAERQSTSAANSPCYFGNNDAVRDIRWSPGDGVMFAAATDSGTIQCWDYRHLKGPVLRITAHEKPCYTVDWHPDGKHLVSGGTDKQVKVWDFSSTAERRQKPIAQFRTPQAVVHVRWRPPSWTSDSDGPVDWQSTQLVTSYDKEDPRIHLWDLRRPHIPFREFDHYDTPAEDLLWRSKDLLWTVGEAGAFTQTDIRFAPQVSNQRPMCAVAWSPQGDIVAVTQKRPRPRLHAMGTTEFPEIRGGLENDDDNFVGQHLVDEVLEEVTPPGSFRPRSNKAAPKQSKSLGNTPPTSDDTPIITPLEKALAAPTNRLMGARQLGAIGRVPGIAIEPQSFRSLAKNYASLMTSESGKVTITSLLSDLEHNAESAEIVGLTTQAQTWRIVKYAVVRELQSRMQERQLGGPAGKPFDQKGNIAGDGLSNRNALPEGSKSEKMRSHLFKGVLETQAHRRVTPDAESTSNMTTPLAKPVPDSPLATHHDSVTKQPSITDEVDLQPLPPSVMSSHYSGIQANELEPPHFIRPGLYRHESQSSENAASTTSEPAHEESLNDIESTERSAPRAIAGQATWRRYASQDSVKQVSEDDYDAKIEDKKTFLREYKLTPKRLLSYEPMAGEINRPVNPGHFLRHDSSESFPMFSASTDSSHKAKSMGESFSPRARPAASFRRGHSDLDESGTDENAIEEDELSPTSLTGRAREESFSESLSDYGQVHLERPRHPIPLIVESSPIDKETKVESRTEPPPYLAVKGDENWQGLSLPLELNSQDSHPWNAQVLLREAVRYYHSNGPVDVQFAAHLLHKIHILFGSHGEIVPPEECTVVFKMYNELLLREGMFVEAAELRKFCVGKYPSVYEYSQGDTFINVFCYTCKRVYDNPVKDNLQCHRCKTRQDPCPLCLSLEPPSEWIKESSKLPSSPGNNTEKGYFNISFASDLTEPITASEVEETAGSAANSPDERPKGSALWCWCQYCGHGAHVACMTTWLKDADASEGACPSAGCFHDCGPGIRRAENRATYLEESGRRDSSRKTNSFVVKQDSWATGESKAVEKVRGMLGSASTGGTSGLPGAGSSSGGTMSPKKVRLVAPGEQSTQKFNGLADSGETYPLKERESTSELFPSST